MSARRHQEILILDRVLTDLIAQRHALRVMMDTGACRHRLLVQRIVVDGLTRQYARLERAYA